MYSITETQDVSRPRCKRYMAHIGIDSDGKDEVKTDILKATEEIKAIHNPCHAVRLYVHIGEKLICQSMRVDKTFTDAPLPKPLKYNDSVGDVGIVW